MNKSHDHELDPLGEGENEYKVRMMELRRDLGGANVFNGRHSGVLPGPHLAEFILPSIRHVGQLVKHYSHH